MQAWPAQCRQREHQQAVKKRLGSNVLDNPLVVSGI
jgi:hypothetical protein